MTMLSTLTEEASRLINKVMSELLEQVEAEAVFFCDRGGNIIARQSANVYPHEQNIAALASGSFFATLEMARLLGESKFRRLIHQGEKTSIYMEGMKNDMLLIVVFTRDSNPGLVKLYARNARQKLEQIDLDTPGGKGRATHTFQFEMDESAQPFAHTVRAEHR
jgi:predicted regulator of Ras-like GTPase activity (Roadblock/LC7/MglB family)